MAKKPSSIVLAALRLFAAENGRNWKAKLCEMALTDKWVTEAERLSVMARKNLGYGFIRRHVVKFGIIPEGYRGEWLQEERDRFSRAYNSLEV